MDDILPTGGSFKILTSMYAFNLNCDFFHLSVNVCGKKDDEGLY